MREFGDPEDPVTQIDRLTAITEEDFAGVRSRDPAGARPERLEFSHAAAIVLIEEGADDEAVERVRALAPRVRPAPTRSAADALIVLSQALAGAESTATAHVDAVLSLSSDFWDDERPSAFIAFAAVVAYLRAGRVGDARTVVRGAGESSWFLDTAEALIALHEGSPEVALPLLEAATAATSLPRLRVSSEVLAAVALALRGLPEAAAARLEGVWGAYPAPRLLRFALRLLTADGFDALAQAVGATASSGLADALVAAAEDPRPRAAPPALSPVEQELITLLGRGLSNPEIAESRSVSLNTVRTQLRTLYRKLGVANRSEAVAKAIR